MRIKVGFLIISSILATGCKTGSGESALHNDNVIAPTTVAAPDIDYMKEGFTIKVNVDARDVDGDGDVNEPTLLVQSANGSTITESTLESGFALDQSTLATGEVVFTWPAEGSVQLRDYAALGKQMTQYAKLVGTLLHRTPEGPGEQAWTSYIRSDNFRKLSAARPNGVKAYCNAVVKQLIDRFVPSGSDYRQYGNCGEGGIVGNCLAYTYGFQTNETRMCLSANDHMFAMVNRGVENGTDYKWYIMDRWDLIGNFTPGVDVDNASHQITKNGQVTGQNWFQRAGCATFADYLNDPDGSLYDRVARY